MYKNGIEKAWVTFSKNTEDFGDNWFRSIRVLDSYPWNTTELQADTTFYGFSLESQDMFWLISEGYEHNSGAIGSFSAHAHWLVYKRSHKCDLMADTELPMILYSRESGPRYLATEGISFICELSNCIILFNFLDIIPKCFSTWTFKKTTNFLTNIPIVSLHIREWLFSFC